MLVEGAGTSDRRRLTTDQLGSVVAVTNASGAATSINTYDEYGTPGSSNQGRFQFTGHAWIPEASLYHFRARAYAPTIGRFLQSDPILWNGGMNLYAYVENDPVNRVDPLGLQDHPSLAEEDITVVAPKCSRTPIGTLWCEMREWTRVFGQIFRPVVNAPPQNLVPESGGGVEEEEIVVTGRRDPRFIEVRGRVMPVPFPITPWDVFLQFLFGGELAPADRYAINQEERAQTRQACHERCRDEYTQWGPPGIRGSDNPTNYLRCMRACMHEAGYTDY